MYLLILSTFVHYVCIVNICNDFSVVQNHGITEDNSKQQQESYSSGCRLGTRSSVATISQDSLVLEDSDTDELYDNGVLGLGFVEKSIQACMREEILQQIRRENDQHELVCSFVNPVISKFQLKNRSKKFDGSSVQLYAALHKLYAQKINPDQAQDISIILSQQQLPESLQKTLQKYPDGFTAVYTDGTQIDVQLHQSTRITRTAISHSKN